MSPLTPPIQPQPLVKEWIELYDKGVISREELRHQLALATRAGEGSTAPEPRIPESAAPVPLRQEESAAPAAA